MSLIVELIKERDRLREAIKAIDVIINYHTTEEKAKTVKAILNTDLPGDLKLEFFKNEDYPKTPTGRPKKEFKVGDRFEFRNANAHAAGNYLTVGKMYHNNQPGHKLVIFDDNGKIRKYGRQTVHNWFRAAGHASDDKLKQDVTR